MTKQSATAPIWLKIAMWIPVPFFLFFAGERFVEEDILLSGLMAFFGLFWFFRRMKSVNEAAIVTVGVRFSVAAFFFYAGAEREMGHLSNAIGWGIAGLLVYAWLFRPDWSVVGIGVAENASEAKDDSATDESETPE